MAKKKATPKKLKKKKTKKPATAKKAAQKAKGSASRSKKAVVNAKASASAKSKANAKAKAKVAAPQALPVKSKSAPKKTPPSPPASVARGSQEVETVRLKPKSRVARAGTGAGDLQGISTVEDVDSESADELLEEGQAFEAGIVSGVERAGNAQESEVVTHEVLEDDVPKEYDDQDRP
jgi:hypothetical protein